MATNNAVNTSLSGQTGTGSFVGSVSPVIATPTIGAAIATTVAFSPTTGGIIGTTTNDNTSAGNVGEFISSQILFASAVNIPNSTATNLTSISLTAGDWDVFGNIRADFTVTGSEFDGWISSTSATLPDASLRNIISGGAFGVVGFNAPVLRFSLSGTTTIFISGFAVFGAGTAKLSGGLYARRRR